MKVDVSSQVLIEQPREVVAAYACDPDHATAWYVNIKVVEWETPRPVGVGSRISFQAAFLGRRLSYTYQVSEMVPGRLFVMRTEQGPFPMETSYQWQDAGEGATRMTLRNRGEPAGFKAVTAPVMAAAMRRANSRDLARLKDILEAQA